MRVVLAEDNYLLREGTRRLLEDGGEIEVVASVGTGVELLDAVRRLLPAAVVTDIRMPPDHHMEGIEAALLIRAEHPDIGVVVLSQHSDAAYALALFENGTDGLAYLLKERVADLDELARALREVAAGRSVVDPDVVSTLVARRVRRGASPLSRLTPRETEVLREMAGGRSNPGIAAALVLGVGGGEARRLGADQAARGPRLGGRQPASAGGGGADLPSGERLSRRGPSGGLRTATAPPGYAGRLGSRSRRRSTRASRAATPAQTAAP